MNPTCLQAGLKLLCLKPEKEPERPGFQSASRRLLGISRGSFEQFSWTRRETRPRDRQGQGRQVRASSWESQSLRLPQTPMTKHKANRCAMRRSQSWDSAWCCTFLGRTDPEVLETGRSWLAWVFPGLFIQRPWDSGTSPGRKERTSTKSS